MPIPRHEIEQHIPSLRRYARALQGNAAEADDLVQDCLERALGRWHLWRRDGDLRCWLFTIMHNINANKRRRQSIRPDRQSIDDMAFEPAVAPAQGDAVQVTDMNAALQALPVEQREVILLVAVEGLRYEEAAKATGVPVGTVMSRLARGRERLKVLTDGGTRPGLRRVK